MPILAAFMVPHPPLIVPAVGKGGEIEIEETAAAYRDVAGQIAALRPETIVITSPHTVMYSDYFHISPGNGARGSFSQFGAPQVRFDETYDVDLRDTLCQMAAARDFPAGTLGERDRQLDHGVMVPLWFIRKEYSDFKLVRIGLSGLSLTDHYKLGQMIARSVELTGRRTVIVASGDLSHKTQPSGPYGFAKEGPEYDARIMDVCGRAAFGELFDFDEAFCERAAECGHRSFVIMAGAFDGLSVSARALSHQDVTGVGYGICTFYPQGPDPKRCFLNDYLEKTELELKAKRAASDAYVQLARSAVEHYAAGREIISVPRDLPRELTSRRAGTFVSIHKHGRLRGCIGTIAPTTANVAEEIIRNAVSASANDPRFDPIRPEELKWLEISVDVLGEPEDIRSMEELDVKRYGVIVSCGRKRGLLLPDLEGVDTVEQQVDIARQKGGISKRDPYTLQRFEVIRHY